MTITCKKSLFFATIALSAAVLLGCQAKSSSPRAVAEKDGAVVAEEVDVVEVIPAQGQDAQAPAQDAPQDADAAKESATNKTADADKTDKTDETDKTDKTNESEKVDETNKMDAEPQNQPENAGGTEAAEAEPTQSQTQSAYVWGDEPIESEGTFGHCRRCCGPVCTPVCVVPACSPCACGPACSPTCGSCDICAPSCCGPFVNRCWGCCRWNRCCNWNWGSPICAPVCGPACCSACGPACVSSCNSDEYEDADCVGNGCQATPDKPTDSVPVESSSQIKSDNSIRTASMPELRSATIQRAVGSNAADEAPVPLPSPEPTPESK